MKRLPLRKRLLRIAVAYIPFWAVWATLTAAVFVLIFWPSPLDLVIR